MAKSKETPNLNARLPHDIKEMLIAISKEDDRSQTSEIIYLIKERYKQIMEKTATE